MKRLLNFIIVIFVGLAIAVSCYDDQTDFMSSDVRISLFPEPATFEADGTTTDGDESFAAVVTINRGSGVSDEPWTAEILNNVSWAHLSYLDVVSTNRDVLGEGSYDYHEKGVDIAVDPNTGSNRSFKLKITTDSGVSKEFTFTQISK